MQLSKRLLACSQFVHSGDRVADVGCDHGYLSIYLLKNNIAASVIASDINKGPLQSAVANAQKFGVSEHIRFYLSDGVASIPREFDCMIVAGMGGDTMISILEAAKWLQNKQYRLILQCQSKNAMLRQYLSDNGWVISNEIIVRDGRFLYTVMEVLWQPDGLKLTVGQTHFSPALLKNPTEEVSEYYLRLIFSLRRAVAGRGEQAGTAMVAALTELEQLDTKHPWLKEASQWQP